MTPAPRADQRPPAGLRRFTSPAVEQKIAEVDAHMRNRELALLFRNCFPNTLDTTITHSPGDAQAGPDTYVITGDIAAMWLRDSTAQVWPYLGLLEHDAALARMVAGLIGRQARCVLLDPYANAFYAGAESGEWREDRTQMRPGVHERKWELDSLAYFLRLSNGYAQASPDRSPFDAQWFAAFDEVLATLRTEQGASATPSTYRFRRLCDFGDSLSNGGAGDPALRCGLVRSAFRPSDDQCKLPYLVPANLMMATELERAAVLLRALGQPARAAAAQTLASEIEAGLEQHAVLEHTVHGEIWAYEVDGFGGRYLMDDANVPSLLSLAYLGVCSRQLPRYRRTRAFCLSESNPYFAVGAHASGIGSPHTGHGTIWPIAIIMQALTADSAEEIATCLRALRVSHAGTGFMHEAFAKDAPGTFTRSWFAWANSLFAELILTLHRDRPEILAAP